MMKAFIRKETLRFEFKLFSNVTGNLYFYKIPYL